MSSGRQPHGYTIVEVMIFLVITGVLLASALLVFNGRRQRTEFAQGVRETDAQLRTIINETATGYYANNDNIDCRVNGVSGNVEISAGSQERGTNEGCIFLGKVIKFTQGSDYSVYTVVGRQRTNNNTEVTALGNGVTQNGVDVSARQTLITNNNAITGAVATYTLPWGITVEKIIVDPPGTQQIGAVGLISTLGAYTGASNEKLQSGSATIDLVPLGNGLSTSETDLINQTRAMTDSQRNSGKIILCLRSGDGSRQASITLGEGSTLGTETTIDSWPEECNNA